MDVAVAPILRHFLYYSFIWISFEISIHSCAEEDCGRVQLSGARYQSSREGIYNMLARDHNCHSKRVYKQDSSEPNFIFYMVTDDGWEGWMVGSALCQNKGGIATKDRAAYPTEVKEPWEEVFTNTWWYNYNLHVECAPDAMSVEAIVGIVIAVLIVLIVVGTLSYCLCCKGGAQKRTTHRTHHNPAPAAVCD